MIVVDIHGLISHSKTSGGSSGGIVASGVDIIGRCAVSSHTVYRSLYGSGVLLLQCRIGTLVS